MAFRFDPARLDSSHDPATAIATRLRRIGGADAIGVRVHLDGDTVRMTGRVPSWSLKQLATSAALSTSADFEIANELTVTN